MFGASKSKGGYGKITMILVGIGMITVASTCFKDVPFIGTVFLMPGENILQTRMADPVLRYALFLIGGLFTAYGVQLQIRIGFGNPLKESNQPATSGKSAISRRKPRRKPWNLA